MALSKRAVSKLADAEGEPTQSRQSLRDKAYDAIRLRINTLEYRPGAYINEAMICDELDIGRTPVHLAIERLALEGLVEVMPRKGVIVAPVSFDEMKQINETRRMIEPPAAALAARWATEAELKLLKQIGAATKKVAPHDTKSLMDLDRELHTTIADATRNRVLAAVLKGLHERSLRNWYISLSDARQRETVGEEHAEIIDRIVARDPDGAERVMIAHIDSFKRRADSFS